MTRKMDWDTITGWEKRIKVDFGSLGPNHPRWSDWTWKERDIVARKVHESASISRDFGPRSKQMEDWAAENAPVMIDFARDGKPMPDWAHAGFRDSGVPGHVEVVWQRKELGNPASPGDWAYDPPGPWDEGEEPPWSVKPKELDESGGMHSKFGGVISYRTAANGDHIATDGTVISTAESRAKEDVPDWRKFELGRLEDVDGIIVPGPNALPKDEERFGMNVQFTKRHKVEKPTKIMPDDPKFTPVQKALSWAKETQHGIQHQNRWNEVAAALGADNGYTPMSAGEMRKLWERFNRNARWSMAMDAMNGKSTARDPVEDANRYRKAVGLPPVEKSQSDKLRDALVETNKREDVVVKEFNPETGTLDEIKGEVPQYRIPGTMTYGPGEPPQNSTGWYTREIKWLPDWYWDLPELTDDEAKAQGVTSRAQVAPLNYIYHKKGVGILGRQKRAPERTDLPVWTKAEAAAYYQSKGIKMRSRQWLDGHLMQQPGYTDTGDGNGEFVARAADEEYEKTHKTIAVPEDIADCAKTDPSIWDKLRKLLGM